jgi:hypothetical protein
MISAMYENGGNTTHRHLDGHPELFVYPFESQLGTKAVHDQFASMFPNKYRWPVFELSAEPHEDFRAIIDEETKVRARTPYVSKFRDWPFELDDNERCQRFVERVGTSGRSRAGNVLNFFAATFDTWRDLRRSGRERYYVGYSPVIVLDAETILAELPDAHIVHVVRNPWSAYAETRRRPVPLDLAAYVLQWVLNQHLAHAVRSKHPDRVMVVRYEDLIGDATAALAPLCARLGIDGTDDVLGIPTWNGERLTEVYPWGTIRRPSPEANAATGSELTSDERDEVTRLAGPWLDILGYTAL